VFALCSSRVVLLAAVFAFGLFAPPATAQVYEGRELVKAELLADTTAVVAGKPFTVGVLLKMAPHWHTYWKFPGDAGLPTEIKWSLPPGWKAGEIQWPTPLKLSEPGDIDVYGYHDEVLLMQEITPPAGISETQVKMSAEANWLVCEKICIPGGATLQLDLPVGGSAAPANDEVFARFRRSLPQPWPSADVATAEWSRAPTELTLRIKSAVLANHPVVEFHPLPSEDVVVAHPTVERTAEGIAFRIPIETSDAAVQSIPGVVVFGQTADGADRNAWQLGAKPAAAAQTAAAPKASLSPAPAASGGIAKFLLFGFIGGFILNLMPCVLPVISLKIFGFIQHAGHDRRQILHSGLAFVAGIFVWFIALALLLMAIKSAGGEVGWAVQFTNPYFVLGMSVIVLVFAVESLRRLRDHAAATRESNRRDVEFRPGAYRLVLPRRLRDNPRHVVHRAGARHGGRFRADAIKRRDHADVPRDRCGHGLAVSPALRTARVGQLAPETRRLDGAREAAHGLPDARHARLPALRAR
jgi:thiol:disulfide interchange protein DsbD